MCKCYQKECTFKQVFINDQNIQGIPVRIPTPLNMDIVFSYFFEFVFKMTFEYHVDEILT